MPGEPTLLRALVTGRHWQKFATFEVQFRRAAQELAEQQHEPTLGKVTVSPRQWERWYAGKVKTEPYPDACRVLEHMFGYSVRQLLAPASQTAPPAPGREEPLADNLAPFATGLGITGTASPAPTLTPPRDTLTPPRDTQPPDELAVLLCHLQTLTALGPDDTLSARQRDDVFTQLVQFLTTWTNTMRVMQKVGSDLATTSLTCDDTVDDLVMDEFCISLYEPS